MPPPPEIMDMTRGALRITDQEFPGAYHRDLFYITVVGDAIQGVPQRRKSLFFEPTTVTGFAYSSYQAVSGDGTALGDGVVPLSHAHLKGAKQIPLPGVFHSINAPDNWYGSDAALDSWHDELVRQLESKKLQRR